MGEGLDAGIHGSHEDDDRPVVHADSRPGAAAWRRPPRKVAKDGSAESHDAATPCSRDAARRAGAHRSLRPMASILCSRECDRCSAVSEFPSAQLAGFVGYVPCCWSLRAIRTRACAGAVAAAVRRRPGHSQRLRQYLHQQGSRRERQRAPARQHRALASLGAKGRVIVDDAHQGLVSFYDPDKFFGDSRLHRTLLWLLAIVAGVRARTAAAARRDARSWQPLDVTSFVRATGGFMARVLRPAAAGQRLFANFFNEIRGRLGLAPDGAPLWDWLAGPRGDTRRRDLDRHAGTASPRRCSDVASISRSCTI